MPNEDQLQLTAFGVYPKNSQNILLDLNVGLLLPFWRSFTWIDVFNKTTHFFLLQIRQSDSQNIMPRA